jgi:2-polyprenyl-3-methyl-5-hydroxy-6-metoxy-1,4-benzoquinol methylase
MSRLPYFDRDTVAEVMAGHYARKQLGSRSRLIAWSHRRRLQMAYDLVKPFAGTLLLDYGCGDGTFLGLISRLFPDAIGADADEEQVLDCRKRFASLEGLRFTTTARLASPEYAARFDLITCMEVLEHCLDIDAERVLNDFERLLAPGGTVLISVPIEIGPTLLVKEVVRAVAGWRRIGDYQYRDTYGLAELLRMVRAGNETIIERPRYPFGEGLAHSHKGFNWRRLRSRLSRSFLIREIRFSPFNIAGGWCGSQVWFRCGRAL